jgi:2-dehydro-3-deoxyphosphogluconate aldolase/(4S)-4-hydroxy-2-oxoglutarate aldolase
MPTGGIDIENAVSYLNAGAACLGIGGNLVNRKAVESERLEKIRVYAKELMQTVRESEKGE